MSLVYLGANVEMNNDGVAFKLNNAAVVSLTRRLKSAEDVVPFRGNTRGIDDGISILRRKCNIVQGWMYAYGALQWSTEQIVAVDALMSYAHVGGPQFCAWFQDQWEHYELGRDEKNHERYLEALKTISLRQMREALDLSNEGVLTLPCPDMVLFRKHMVVAWEKRQAHGVMWFQRNRGRTVRRWSTSMNGPPPRPELTAADAATNAQPRHGRDDAHNIPVAPHDHVISTGAGNLSPDGHCTTDLF